MSSIAKDREESLDSQTHTNTQPTCFLKLPSEIRHYIYDLLMVPVRTLPEDRDVFDVPVNAHPKDRDVVRMKRYKKKWGEHRTIDQFALSHYFFTALMRTCRQLHAETVHFYYSRVTLLLHFSKEYHPPYLWPYLRWHCFQLGLLTVELVLRPCDDCSILSFFKNFEGVPDAQVNRLIVHHDLRYCPTDRRYAHLRVLRTWFGGVKEVVVGKLLDRHGDVDVRAYWKLKEALSEVPKWTIMDKDKNRFHESE